MSIKTMLSVLMLTLFANLVHAAALPQPEGPVILSVTGAIENGNTAQGADFDLDLLRTLDWVEIETYTSFTEGKQTFAGPTLTSLLAAVQAEGTRMNAAAINGYFVEIPLSHAAAHNVILAVEQNGKRMRIRDKGPIWVVYPLSEEDAGAKPFDTEMIWQLRSLEILP